MKELLTYIIQNLVSNKDQLNITETINNNNLNLTIFVSADDVGKVIGKGGKIIRAIRTVIKAAALKTGQKVFVEIAQVE